MQVMPGNGQEAMRVPTQPRAHEKQEHVSRQREPYADWCKACVAVRARGAPHRRAKETEEVVTQSGFKSWSEDNTDVR